jgi:hypothetical protein
VGTSHLQGPNWLVLFLYKAREFTFASPSGVMETLGGEVSSTVMKTDATLDRPALLTVTVKMYTPAPTRHQKQNVRPILP